MIESGEEIAPAHQVAALCYRTTPRLEILLVTSRETRRWVTPKGWPMKDRADPDAAAREAFEEAGVEGAVAREPFGAFGYDKTLKSGLSKPVLAALYPLKVEVEHSDWPERKQRARIWYTVEEAAAAVREDDLSALILGFGAGYLRDTSVKAGLVRAVRRLFGGDMATAFETRLAR